MIRRLPFQLFRRQVVWISRKGVRCHHRPQVPGDIRCRLRQAKPDSMVRQKDVRGLQIPVSEAVSVQGFERCQDAQSNLDYGGQFQGSAGKSYFQRFVFVLLRTTNKFQAGSEIGR
jgi:hypothetical protein